MRNFIRAYVSSRRVVPQRAASSTGRHGAERYTANVTLIVRSHTCRGSTYCLCHTEKLQMHILLQMSMRQDALIPCFNEASIATSSLPSTQAYSLVV